jgi:tetratricopeptide (TPR) repeat protein
MLGRECKSNGHVPQYDIIIMSLRKILLADQSHKGLNPMNISETMASLPSVGKRLRNMRKARGMTQEALAAPEYTKGYISALERGGVRPSLKALDFLARRLGVPIADFLDSSAELTSEQDVEAQREDLLYQCSFAQMLIRVGKSHEAIALINELEQQVQHYAQKLPPNMAYMLPFVRGMAHLQSGAPRLAHAELEAALEAAKGDVEASAQLHNLLGTVFLALDLPQLALEQHLEALKYIRGSAGSATRDPDFAVNVYRNLANDYWALNEFELAIGLYKEALPILEDLSDLKLQATAIWQLAEAHSASNDWPHAKLNGLRALHIIEAADNRAEAAYICLDLSKIKISEDQFEEASELLKRAEKLVAGTGDRAAMSQLYHCHADLARRQGHYEKATEHAERSIALAQANFEAAQSVEGQANYPTWQGPAGAGASAGVYAEALLLGALVEEDQGNQEAADLLFERALALVQPAGMEKTRHAVNLGYARVLEARGDFKRAVSFYRIAAELQAYSRQRSF